MSRDIIDGSPEKRKLLQRIDALIAQYEKENTTRALGAIEALLELERRTIGDRPIQAEDILDRLEQNADSRNGQPLASQQDG